MMRNDMSTKTLTLQTDEDVLLRLGQQAQQEHTTTERVAAEALRGYALSLPEVSAKDDSSKASAPEPFRMQTHSAGRCFLDNVDKTWEVIAWAEGEDFR